MRLSGSQLILLFPATARFSMGQVAKSHEAISTAVEEVTAARFHVKCAVNEPEGGDIGGQQGQPDQMPPPSGEQANRPTAVPKGAATREDVDPSVRSVLDAFDGEIV